MKGVATESCSGYGYPNEHILNAGVMVGKELLKAKQKGPKAVEIDEIVRGLNATTVRVVYCTFCLVSEFFHPSLYSFSRFWVDMLKYMETEI